MFTLDYNPETKDVVVRFANTILEEVPRSVGITAGGLVESNFRLCPGCGRSGLRREIVHGVYPKALEGLLSAVGLKSKPSASATTNRFLGREIICRHCNAVILRITFSGKSRYFSSRKTWVLLW